MPQNLIRCSACNKRVPEKLAQATWAWVDAERLRTAVRQRLCVACFSARVLAYDRELDPDEPLRCIGCGVDVEDAPSITYCTAFVPGAGKLEFAFAACEAHAIDMHNLAREGCVVLQERESMVGGQAPSPPQELPALAAWRALGIEARE